MIVEDLYVASASAWLPNASNGAVFSSTPKDCINDGGINGIFTEPRLSALEMAVRAVNQLNVKTSVVSSAVDVLIHATTYHQGQDLSPLASTILDRTFGGPGIALEIKQMSNGGLCALHLAACLRAAQPNLYRKFILSAGERYCLPGIDRWKTDPGTPYGDGAAAIHLTSGNGPLRVLAVTLKSDSTLQGLHQSNAQDTHAPFAEGGFVEFERSKRQYMTSNPVHTVISRVNRGQNSVIEEALSETGLRLDEIDCFVVPHFGKRRLTSIYAPLGIPLEKTLWSWSREIGHLGAGDQFAGVNELMKNKKLIPGQHIMLLSVGAGYTWGSAILQAQ